MLPLMLLLSAATTPPPATPAQPPSSLEKVKCRTTPETGSLAKVHRECHTLAEWRAREDAARGDIQQMQDHTGSMQQPN